MAPLVTVCLIARDESANINRALASVRALADEVVVYDTGSVDDTVERAAASGARTVRGTWPDSFAAARNAALEHCRSTWVLSLDADEELVCSDPVALRALLSAAPPEILAFQLSIDNLVGVGTAPAYAHVAERLFRRERCTWRGRLHEQLVEAASGKLAPSAYLGAARLVHHGYAAAALADRRKLERNLALARAEVEHPSLGDRGIALVALGRALWGAGRPEEALRPLLEGAASTTNATARRQGLTAAVRILLALGRLDEAGETLEHLRRASTNPITADVLGAGLALARKNFGRALALLSGAGGANRRDDDGYAHSDAALAEWRAAALLGLGRADEAVELLLGFLRQSGALVAELDLVVEALLAAGRPLGELAAATPAAARNALIAAALLLAPERAEAVVEALWSAVPAPATDDTLLAGAALVGRVLEPEAAARWSARLRAAGHASLCPLVAQATDAALPARRRAGAALAALGTFEEKLVVPDLESALAALDPTRLDDLLAGERRDLVEQHLAAARALAEPTVRRLGATTIPDLSVVLLARGGPETVFTSLGLLAASLPSTLSFEIVIVDTASTDATPVVVNGVRGDVVVVRTECPLGAGAARSLGAEAASGGILVFLDSSVQPRPGWLAPLVGRLQERRRIGAAGPTLVDRAGRVLCAGASARIGHRPRPPAGGLRERPWGASAGASGVSVTWLGRSEDEWRPDPDEPRSGPLLPAWALAVRASAFAQVGGFHPGYWAGGDGFDLCCALQDAGWASVCERRSSVQLPEPFDPLAAPWAALPLTGESAAPGRAAAAAADDEALFLARWGESLPHRRI